MGRGRFITFEGGEGAGKTTQIRRLASRLGLYAPEIVLTREPGGSAGAETLRGLLVRGAADRWSATAETLILYAARADHLDRLIRPALARGAWVLSDRFADSTRAYQGAAGGASEALISGLERQVVGADGPDLTVVLDLPPEIGLARALGRDDDETRFETKSLAFHARLRAAYLEIARAEPGRCTVVDAAQPADAVEVAIWTALSPRIADLASTPRGASSA